MFWKWVSFLEMNTRSYTLSTKNTGRASTLFMLNASFVISMKAKLKFLSMALMNIWLRSAVLLVTMMLSASQF